MLTAWYPSGPGELSRWRTIAQLRPPTIFTKYHRSNGFTRTLHIVETPSGRNGISFVWVVIGIARDDEMTSLPKPHPVKFRWRDHI